MKDKVELSFLVVGDERCIERHVSALGSSFPIQTLNLDSVDSIEEPSASRVQWLYQKFGWVLSILSLLLLFFLGAHPLVVGIVIGFGVGFFCLTNYYEERTVWSFLRPLFLRRSKKTSTDIVAARIMRFYGCHNPLSSVFNKIFNRTQGKVVIISGSCLPRDCWGVLHTTFLDILQGVPSISVLVLNLKTEQQDQEAFENGFDFVVQPDEVAKIPDIAKRQFFLFGRNRVTFRALIPGVVLGVLGSLTVGIASHIGKEIGTLVWSAFVSP